MKYKDLNDLEADIILTGDEADWFMKNALFPDPEMIEKRDKFFEEIDAMGIVHNEGGSMSCEIPDIKDIINE